MKHLKFKNALIFATIMFAGLVCFGVIPVSAIAALFATGKGISLASAAAASSVNGTATTTAANAAAPDLLRPAIDKKITQMRPSAYPLDTILRSIGNDEKIGSWEAKWYSVDIRGVNSAMAAGHTNAWSSTTWTNHGPATISVTNGHIWSVDDLIYAPGTLMQNGAYVGEEMMLQVIAKPSTSTLTVICLTSNDTFDVPTIANGTALVRAGNAKQELDMMTDPYEIYPFFENNYAQIHMATVEQSVYEALHTEKEVSFGMNDYRLSSIYSMREGMEIASLIGKKRHVLNRPVGASTKEYYYSNGVVRYITRTLTYNSSGSVLDNSRMINWSKQVFTGNGGSDEKVFFVGSDLMESLHGVQTVAKQLEAGNTEVKWGLTFKRFESNFGSFLIKYHPGLDRMGWAKHGLILDIANLGTRIFKPMGKDNHDLQKAAIRRANAETVSTAYCAVVRYPETHAIVKFS